MHAPAPIAVWFDGDATLWDFHALLTRVMAETIEHLVSIAGPVEGDLSTEAFISDRDREAVLACRRLSHEQLRRLGFAASVARLGLADDGLSEELTRFFFERRFSSVELYSDTLPCLTALREHDVLIGLLSNGNTYPDRVGMGDYFDAALFAHELPAAKPDHRAFIAAEQALPAHVHVMVGDDPVDDVVGGRDAGWLTAWIDRGGASPARRREVGADLTVSTLTELPAWIDSLSNISARI